MKHPLTWAHVRRGDVAAIILATAILGAFIALFFMWNGKVSQPNSFDAQWTCHEAYKGSICVNTGSAPKADAKSRDR